MSRQLGSTDAEIDAVLAGDFTAFDPSWSAALAAANEMTNARGTIGAATYERLAAHWSAAEIVEIVSVAAAFAMFNRFANALEIPPTT